MRISVLIMGIVLVGTLITGLYSFTNDLASSNGGFGVSVDSQYSDAFDKTQNISDDISDRYDRIQNLSANTESSIGVVTLVPQVLIIAKNMVTLPFTIVGGMITSIVEFMGLPAWVETFLLAGISILIVFALVAIILRFRHT